MRSTILIFWSLFTASVCFADDGILYGDNDKHTNEQSAVTGGKVTVATLEGIINAIKSSYPYPPPRRKEYAGDYDLEKKMKGAGSMYIGSKEDIKGNKWGGKKTLGYSLFFKKCEINLPDNVGWDEIIDSHGKRVGNIEDSWAPSYTDMLKGELGKLTHKYGSTGKSATVIIPPEELNKTIRRIKKFGPFIQKCQGLLFSSTHSDFSNNANYDDKVSQVNPELVCIARDGETQDYKSCVKMVNVHDGFYLARQVNTTTQQVRGQLHGEKVQDRVLEKMNEGDNTKSALEGQKDLIKKRAQFAKERMVLSASEAAALEAARRSMPTMKSLLTNCRTHMEEWNRKFKNFVAGATSTLHLITSGDAAAAGAANGETGPSPQSICRGTVRLR